MKNVIAVDIGGTRFRVGLFDSEGCRLKVLEGETSREGGRAWMLEQLRERCRELQIKSGQSVAAAGVSFGGPVDYEAQRVNSLHVSGWKNFALGEWFRQTLGWPCRVDNDANAGALGESRFGAGRGARSLVYITLSTGIGGGLVFDGRVFHGRDSLAGEIGHIPVSDSGVMCACGARGCLEAYCSGTAIAQRGQEVAKRRSEIAAQLIELSDGISVDDITARGVLRAAAAGHHLAIEILHEESRWLARALLILMRILNPDKIVLGGGVAQAGPLLLNPVREALRELASPAFRTSTEVVTAELENYSPLYGAAAMALDLVAEERL